MKFNNSLFNRICLLAIIVILLIGAMSCSSSKNISTTNRQVDNTVINEKDSIIQLQITEIERLTAEIRELQYAGVTFDNDSGQHPVILIEKGIDCNVDSIMAIMDIYKNKVKISADGTIQAEGKLKSAYYSRDKLSRFIVELQHRYDSLSEVKQKEVLNALDNGERWVLLRAGLF